MEKDEGDDVMEEVRILREKIDKECPNSIGRRLVSLLGSMKELEKQELDFQSQCSSDCSRLQKEVDELDKMLNSGANYVDSDAFHHSFQDSSERLESVKKEHATKLRAILSLKRQLDEVPSQAELIQYELRLSELNTQIQKTLRQTRKHYDTYNALLEIKDLMLKETSLLNSINLQFQNAITSADGRIKLTNSLEGILYGTQQKLDKVQLTHELEQKSCNTIKEKYTAAISEQRRSSSLVKLFQEECARNERLRSQMHEHGIS
ncbi:coiled-coil domain-containing protein 93 isoform X1 [Salvia splendens]|uniref:coiled-coil domain-containing protein 93 isoform X1 n=2 Tax=Salvia splendens TaxID=180675 RepID=UPI001C27576C|nr:coiled-coil domain-containing protein 93 isoform X1 [Salvia splendens]